MQATAVTLGDRSGPLSGDTLGLGAGGEFERFTRMSGAL